MTTPAKPERPERMADADLAACAERVGLASDHGEAASPDDGHALADEAIRARAEESRLTRELALSDRLIDEFALAIGYGERPDGRSGVVRPDLTELARLLMEERDVAQNAADAAGALARGIERERAAERTRAENAESERDAAREEAKRLRLVAIRARANITGAMTRTPLDDTMRAYLASALSVLDEVDHDDE